MYLNISDRGCVGIYHQSLKTVSFNITFNSMIRQQEIPLEFCDDSFGLEDPEIVTVFLSALSDPSKIEFLQDTAEITVLDGEGKYF